MRIHPGSIRPALQEIDAATDRLVDTVGALGAAELTAPSLLPGWSRAHVITHIARNADSYCNLLTWARTGVETPQYESTEQRNRDIAAGAGRSVAALADDVRASAGRLRDAARTLPEEAWHSTVGAFQGSRHPAWYTLFRRWREVEVHHADLDAGYSYTDWPDAYVRWELADTLAWLVARGGLDVERIVITDVDLGDGAGPEPGGAIPGGRPGVVVSGSGRDVLGWLAGRTDGSALDVTGAGRSALPVPPEWPRPSAIDWGSLSR